MSDRTRRRRAILCERAGGVCSFESSWMAIGKGGKREGETHLLENKAFEAVLSRAGDV